MDAVVHLFMQGTGVPSGMCRCCCCQLPLCPFCWLPRQYGWRGRPAHHAVLQWEGPSSANEIVPVAIDLIHCLAANHQAGKVPVQAHAASYALCRTQPLQACATDFQV